MPETRALRHVRYDERFQLEAGKPILHLVAGVNIKKRDDEKLVLVTGISTPDVWLNWNTVVYIVPLGSHTAF